MIARVLRYTPWCVAVAAACLIVSGSERLAHQSGSVSLHTLARPIALEVVRDWGDETSIGMKHLASVPISTEICNSHQNAEVRYFSSVDHSIRASRSLCPRSEIKIAPKHEPNQG